LTIELLKKWLVKYKFKNWTEHKTTATLLGTPVTSEQKEDRAKEIADKLSDSNLWKSHGRPINIETLESIRLIIEDYSKEEYRKLIRQYYDLFFDFVTKNGHSIFIQTRKFI